MRRKGEVFVALVGSLALWSCGATQRVATARPLGPNTGITATSSTMPLICAEVPPPGQPPASSAGCPDLVPLASLPPTSSGTTTTAGASGSVPPDAPPSGSYLATRLADPTDLPAGFVSDGIDGGLVGAGGLDNAGRRWTRQLAGGNTDDISLFVTRFASAAKAVDFNAGFSQEYASGRLLRHESIRGVPASDAYLYLLNPGSTTSRPDSGAPSPGVSDQEATAWFTVDSIAVGVYVLDRTEDPLALAEAIAEEQYRLLP